MKRQLEAETACPHLLWKILSSSNGKFEHTRNTRSATLPRFVFFTITCNKVIVLYETMSWIHVTFFLNYRVLLSSYISFNSFIFSYILQKFASEILKLENTERSRNKPDCPVFQRFDQFSAWTYVHFHTCTHGPWIWPTCTVQYIVYVHTILYIML